MRLKAGEGPPAIVGGLFYALESWVWLTELLGNGLESFSVGELKADWLASLRYTVDLSCCST